MPAQDDNELAAPSEMSFEQATEELEELIRRIEEGDIGLEESLAARKRGDALIKRCRSILDGAETLSDLRGVGAVGSVGVEPVEPGADLLEASHP